MVKHFTKINWWSSYAYRKYMLGAVILIENICTLEKIWRVSFSRIGECSRRQASSWKLGGTHQYSLSNKVFNILNLGHHFKSRLKMNWKNSKQKISGNLYCEHNDLRTQLVVIYPKHKCLYRWNSSMPYNLDTDIAAEMSHWHVK